METKTNTRLYQVILTYNIEANDATHALDECLSVSPLKPISFSCEPIDTIFEEDDD